MKKKFLILLFGLMIILAGSCGTDDGSKEITMTKQELLNKVKGGWAGQVIGVTYGGPTEFRYLSRMIPDSVEIPWGDDAITGFFEKIAEIKILNQDLGGHLRW